MAGGLGPWLGKPWPAELCGETEECHTGGGAERYVWDPDSPHPGLPSAWWLSLSPPPSTISESCWSWFSLCLLPRRVLRVSAGLCLEGAGICAGINPRNLSWHTMLSKPIFTDTSLSRCSLHNFFRFHTLYFSNTVRVMWGGFKKLPQATVDSLAAFLSASILCLYVASHFLVE